ncbi:hypothetical protein [Robiginitomaculum antarcticum]|uniref:hypothetical protein n=1 Tax=Robiginitomaculum antarcticum TaxID=437507 RepID=UPI000374C087|nr:hypothetical protein [Robiginitomaculum antarcticum]
MPNFKLTLLATVIATMGLTSVAQAEPNEKWVKKRFAKVDTNADEMIDLEEYIAFRTRNGKGKIKGITKQFNKVTGDDDLLNLEEFKATLKNKKGGKKKNKKD